MDLLQRKKILGCFFAMIASLALAVFIVIAVRYNQSHSPTAADSDQEDGSTTTNSLLLL